MIPVFSLSFFLFVGMLLTAMPATAQAPDTQPNGGATMPPPSPTLSDLGRSLRSYFTEEELSLLFEYMRDSVIAAFKGEEVFLPPDLSFKLEILLVRLKKEGGHYMDNLIRQLEKDLERNLREKLQESLASPSERPAQPANPYLPPQPPTWAPFFIPPPAPANTVPFYPAYVFPPPVMAAPFPADP